MVADKGLQCYISWSLCNSISFSYPLFSTLDILILQPLLKSVFVKSPTIIL